MLIFSGSGPAFADSFYPNSGVDTTDEVFTVPYRHSETFMNFESDELGDGTKASSGLIAFKYGILKRMDFGVQLPYNFQLKNSGGYSGPEDVQFGIKYLCTPPEENHLLASAIFGVKPQTGNVDKALGTGTTDYSFHLALSYLENKWKHHLNYGYNLWGRLPGVPRASTPYYKYKMDYDASERLSYSLEFYGSKSPNLDYYGSPLQTTIKVSYYLRENLCFDAGLAFGLNQDAPVRRYLFGICLSN
ncbi:MAG: transporter [Chloroflexi bacterium]|nr:transporter [Chloroflexota bacterium]